jgi:hypothetical protein
MNLNPISDAISRTTISGLVSEDRTFDISALRSIVDSESMPNPPR